MKLFSCLIYLTILIIGCGEKNQNSEPDNLNPDTNSLTGIYFNEPLPSTTVTRFAPEVFIQELHTSPIFSANGDEVFWSLMGSQSILYMKMINGTWTDAVMAPFNLSGGSDSPSLSSDGSKAVFLSGNNSTKENIWIVEKNNGEWSFPVKLGNEINQLQVHWQASIADNKNLYFGADGDIYCSKYVNGTYITAQKLGSEINSNIGYGYETTPFIAPDESYLIFSDGNSDLRISFKQNDGSWSQAFEMSELNTEGNELYANVSPNGRFIMFLSGRSGILLPYWVDASIIENYRPNY